MVRALLIAAAGVATLAGVVYATPAFARAKPVERNIPCEAPPPAADTIASRQGSVGLQLPGFGISADRARVTSRTDVIIGVEGSEGWLDMTMYLQACHAITRTWPKNPIKQLEELFKVREQLRRGRPKAKAPDTSIISEAEAAAFVASGLGPEGTRARQPQLKQTHPTTAAPQQRAVAPLATYSAPKVTYAAPAATPQRTRQSSCAGNACPYPLDSHGAPMGVQPDTAAADMRSYAFSSRSNCSQVIVGSGMTGGDCHGVAIRTCTIAAPFTIPGVAIQMGSMNLPGMPITISSGETTCSTTTSF